MAAAAKPGDGKLVPLRPARACPVCGRPASRPAYPFCSKRCADIDLNRWLSGAYAITAVEEEPDDGEPERQPCALLWAWHGTEVGPRFCSLLVGSGHLGSSSL